MAKIPLQAEWIDGFLREDGYQLMTLLRQEPRLLTIKYCGCNVLHLAMRNNWYSLVQETLRKFKHLYKDASFLYPGFSSRSEVENPGEDTEDFQSSSTVDSQATTGDLHSKDVCGLGLVSFRDLLEAKEDGGENPSRGKGARWEYKSSLDVFAMAVIQGDVAIKSLLAEAVLQVDGLFEHPHPYEDVVSFRGEEPEETGESNSSPDRHEKERKLLCEIIEKCFPVPHRIDVRIDHELETVSEQPHAASNVSSSEQQRSTDSQATPATSGPKQLEHQLADKIDPEWRRLWELKSPFLPLEECIFLECHSRSSRIMLGEQQQFRNAIRKGLLEGFDHLGKENSFRKYLLGIKDTRGSALHHIVRGNFDVCDWIEEKVPGDGDAIGNYINAHDSAGRTTLYIALALGDTSNTLQLLENKTRIVSSLKETMRYWGRWQFKGREWQIDEAAVSDVNQYSPDPINYGMDTHALHVVIRSPHIMNDDRSELTRICWKHTDGVDPSTEYQRCPTLNCDNQMTWLQLAAYVGDTTILEILANNDTIYDYSRLNNLCPWYELIMPDMRNTVIHVAAAAGHPHAIRTILATGKFDPLVEDDKGNTALHLATHFEAPVQFPHSLADFCEIPNQRIGTSYRVESSLSTEERKDLVRNEESRRQGCINLLLQGGIDIWETNDVKEMADPGPKASPEYSTWWYDKVSKETQEAKTSLNAAANAISVTAALVATASYVGPLQPPLGYAAQSDGLIDKMQVGVPSVRIFIVCNTLAFYLALAAILLSLTPSLPMPQESILDELKLIQRTVTLAVGLLILSMVAILVAFASASIAVIPDEGSWNHGGLTVGTLGVGGFICILVVLLCLFRILRLAFHKRKGVRRFYNKYVCM